MSVNPNLDTDDRMDMEKKTPAELYGAEYRDGHQRQLIEHSESPKKNKRSETCCSMGDGTGAVG